MCDVWFYKECGASDSSPFYPGLYTCYLLTGHDSMNAFLYKRGLASSTACVCGDV